MNLLEIFFSLILLAFVIRTLRNAFYHVFLWQLKEYRVDRILAHLKTPQGKRLILGPVTLIKWVLLVVILIFPFLQGQNIYLISEFTTIKIVKIGLLGFWLILVAEGLINIRELLTTKWRMPRFTPKIIIILLIVLFIQSLSLDEPEISLALLPFLDKFLAPSIAVLMILFNIPSNLYKKILIRRARKKISKLKNLFVIGITGSFGKTSTKEFLTTILSEKYKVAKTPASQNTDIGIAKYIINELRADHEIFVVEMGAYKKGEIKAICEMVHPKMGIITGINEQHIELFGSVEKTKIAKYELIDSLPEGSTAIFNGNNHHCLEMATWAKRGRLNILVYATKEINDIKSFKDHLEFTYTKSCKKYRMSAFLLGTQNIENILAAIYAARNLKMNMVDVKHGVGKITSPDKTMKLYKKPSGMALIDDSFNANPDGAVAALRYMRLYSGKKILVLSPLIELGEVTADVHKKIGKAAAEICDFVFLTNSNFEKSFYDGFIQAGGDGQKIKVASKSSISKTLKKLAGKSGVMMFEGKETGGILNELRIKN